MDSYTLDKREIQALVLAASPHATNSLYNFFSEVLASQNFDDDTYTYCLNYFLRQERNDKVRVCDTLKKIALAPSTERDLVCLIVKYLVIINKPDLTFVNDVVLAMPKNLKEYVVDTVPYQSLSTTPRT